MRTVAGWFASALGGAVVAVLGVLTSHWWSAQNFPAAERRRYVDYLAGDVGTDWVGLIAPAALVGAVLGLAVALVVRLVATRSRAVAVVGAELAAAGVAVLGVLTSHAWLVRDDGGYRGYYSYSLVPNAANSVVSSASDPGTDTDWVGLLVPAALAGAVCGLVLVVVVGVVRRRRTGEGS